MVSVILNRSISIFHTHQNFLRLSSVLFLSDAQCVKSEQAKQNQRESWAGERPSCRQGIPKARNGAPGHCQHQYNEIHPQPPIVGNSTMAFVAAWGNVTEAPGQAA